MYSAILTAVLSYPALQFCLKIILGDQKLFKKTDKPESRPQEIYYHGRFYDVTNFVKRHPGGKVIEFYVNSGQDATVAIEQFHYRSRKRVAAILKSLPSREPLSDEFVITDKQNQKYEQLTQDYCRLYKELENEGAFEANYLIVALRLMELIALAALGIWLVKRPGNLAAILSDNLVIGLSLNFHLLHFEKLASLAFGVAILTLFQIRVGWFMHECVHNSTTGIPKVDRLISSFAFGVGAGLSALWYRRLHNKHHAGPQWKDHDADLRTLPYLAHHVDLLRKEDGNLIYNMFLEYQSLFALPAYTFGGRLFVLLIHPPYMLRYRQFHELAFVAAHYYGVYQIGLPIYFAIMVLSSGLGMMSVYVSHSHTPLAVEPRHWVEYATLHTINVEQSWWIDYYMGYLNYQIEHHLFPSMPNFKLRSISGRVKSLVEKHGLPYTCVSYGTAVNLLVQNLSKVSIDLASEAQARGQKPTWVFEWF